MFELRGKLTASQALILGVAGFVLFIAMWWVAAEILSQKVPVVEGYQTRLPSIEERESSKINLDSLLREDSLRFANATEFIKIYPLLPTPLQVVQSYPSLIKDDALAYNTFRSIWLNVQGYFWAVLLAIPIGFLIGLLPIVRGLFSRQVDALRYLPLTALTGMFIVWFGIDDDMKIAFLAFGILVYLLPVVVQRIDEADDVYLTTVFTLGATNWQTIKSVYLPSVMSKLIDDIRVLTAISWTYIIIAELLNRQGGIGALIYLKSRQGQIPKVFAILIVIILVGFIQDRIFVYVDKRLFPFKYHKYALTGLQEVKYGIFTVVGAIVVMLLLTVILSFFGISVGSTLNSIVIITVIAGTLLVLVGEFKVQQSLRAQER